ncbi:MAG: hypothetical protein WD960_10910 [Gemmatimonadota bacterium]
MVRKSIRCAVLPTLLVACSIGSSGAFMAPGGGSQVRADPVPVLWAANDVFERVGIPVTEMDERGGELRSGMFRVERVWGGEAAAARIRCGPDDDVGLRAGQVFNVSMMARVQSTDGYTSRVRVVGDVTLAESGERTRPGVRCGLREEFRSWVEEEIVRASQLLPPRHRVSVRPD